MKIGYLIPQFPGQTHTWMWREITWMRRWGVDVTLFSSRRPDARDRARHAFAEQAERETIYLWPPRAGELARSLAWASARPERLARCLALIGLPVKRRAETAVLVPAAAILARAVAERGIEHLHAHSCSGSAVLAMMVKRLTGVPFSMTLNANIEWWGGAMAEKFGDAAFTVAITEWLLRQMRREFPALRPEQACLGRIGVDTASWRPPQARAPSPTGGGRVVSVGRLHASKGHDVLIAAMKELVDAGRPVSLTLVGAGPAREELEAQVRRLELGAHVTFTGSLSEDGIVARLSEADLFVLASHAEPLGVVYMEAMSMGLPTIGTRAGGVAEIITDREDGLLVPPNDPHALAEAMAGVLDDASLRQRLGARARRTIEQRFDARFGAATLYERLLGQPPAA